MITLFLLALFYNIPWGFLGVGFAEIILVWTLILREEKKDEKTNKKKISYAKPNKNKNQQKKKIGNETKKKTFH